MGMFGNIKEKLQGKSIDQEIDAAFSQNNTTETNNSDSYSKKVLDASKNSPNQTNQFGMSDSYFHERANTNAQQPINPNQQQEMIGSDFNPENQQQVPDYSQIPSNNDLRISDPTKMDDPHLSVAAPQMPTPLNTQNPMQPQQNMNAHNNQPMQQPIDNNNFQNQQIQSNPQQFSEPEPIDMGPSPTETPTTRRMESLLLEVRTLRSQNEQILEILRHLEKRSI
ncbi:hypothetical protein GQ473_00080 [archaeon]|nr:hypothetical protein [archaeon]